MSRALTKKILFTDGEYFVALTDQLAVRVGMVGGTCFDIPMGHAYFERAAEAKTRVEVEALHNELSGAYA
jgi:hypothetical protein